MTELFLHVVNGSISASWLVLAVLLARLVLKRAPKWAHVLLWGSVGVRLIFPFSLESALSLIPSAETISPTILTDATPRVYTGFPNLNQSINPVLTQAAASAPDAAPNLLEIWLPVLAVLWFFGVAALLGWSAVSYLRLRRRVATAVRLEDNLYQSDTVLSPFVLGLMHPRIYLPFCLDQDTMHHVVAHERAHIQRRDHWWKPLGFVLLSVYWFNPLLWLAYLLLCRDIELACDEKVVRGMEPHQRADYSQALLSCSVRRPAIAACPLAFGFECLAGLKEQDMVNEGDDPAGLGTLIHKVLEIFHGRHLNELLTDRDAASKELVEAFKETIHAPECLLQKTLPPASLAMLEAQAIRKLDKYIHNQPDDSRPILLEAELRATISVCNRDISLMGRIDRMDRREHGLVVLDYKTGHINNVDARLWDMDDFFDKVDALASASTLDVRDHELLEELFQTLRQNASSIQLPCYVTICRSENRHLRLASNTPDAWPDAPFRNAAFVALAEKGQEIPIDTRRRKSKASCEELAERHALVLNRCPNLVELVLMHMHNARELVQMGDPRRCAWCTYARLCQS